MNTAEFLTISASIVPDREALVCEGMRITYKQVLERVLKLANALQGLGVSRGDRVAALSVNCPQYVETYYACAKLGAVFVPLNYRAKQEELLYMVDNSESATIFFGERYLSLLEAIRPQLANVRHYICYDALPHDTLNYDDLLSGQTAEDIFADVEDHDPSIIIYTSGTTALPKGVVLSYLSLSSYILNTVEPATPEQHNIQLVAVPFYHIAGATTIMSSFFGGRTMIILPQFEPESWLAAVQKERATHSFVVPTMLKRVMDYSDFHKYDLGSLQLLSYGAAPMPYDVVRRAVEVFPCDLMNAYGQTESTSTLTFLGPDDHRIQGLSEEEREKKLRRLRSVGKPMSDIEVAIVDPQGRVLGPGEEGEIVARGERIMAGYWKRQEETNQTLAEGWLHTGDVGYLDEDGYLFITGRTKDLIIRGGENIAPGEIEAVLDEHPAVAEAAVIGVADPDWGEAVKAVVVLKPGATAGSEELQQYCRSRLASYKCPKYISFEHDLPRNSLGKVLKNELRKAHGQPAS